MIKLPPSFPSLLLAGFVLVALPLLGGILGMSYALRQMVQEGRQSVAITADITLVSRRLTEAEKNLERAAGQYLVLEDPALKERLQRAHLRFGDVVNQASTMPWDQNQQALLQHLTEQEAQLYKRLEVPVQVGVAGFDALKGDFDRLEATASALADEAAVVVQRQLAGMSQTAERIQTTLVWQVGLLIALSLILSAVLSRVISRPVFQLAQAIRRLGSNDLETLSPISGPGDMVYLGEQLDWLRRRLQELEEQKINFFRDVSHELKTPLTNLLEGVALLHDQVAGQMSEPQQEIVAIMRSSSLELKQRLEDLLRYNEAVSLARVQLAPLALHELVREVVARFDLPRRKKALTLKESVPAMVLNSDRERLAVALENLISNAVKFSPREGVIAISATVEADGLEIRVQDDGPGIDSAVAEKLFQPFQKGPCQSEAPLTSSGLGLAIARAQVESLGGQLSLCGGSSSGACFALRLPLVKEIASSDT